MMTNLKKARTLTEFCNKIRQDECRSDRYNVHVSELKLRPTGKLSVNSDSISGRFPIAEAVLPDLARVAHIPYLYFADCHPRLRSASYNWRVQREILPQGRLQLVIKDGTVDRILNTNLLPAPRLAIMDTVSNAKPETEQRENLRVIQYAWDRKFDVSIIAPTLNCSPREDDLVAFGVNISEGQDGAIQIQGAAFRQWCANGAVNRICDNQQHRLRRPINRPDRQQQFLRNVSVFAIESWHQYREQEKALPKLVASPINLHEWEPLQSRLRQAPFFLSVGVINKVFMRLEWEVAQHQGGASLYDLYNAMSYVGTHHQELSSTYRSRLRAGAGEFSRHEPRICSTCRQLLLK